jgi:tetratricopeptide (TPR) repeat protein
MRRVITLALVGLGLIFLLGTVAFAVPSVRDRVILLPRYVESTLSRYQPTPVAPTPPPETGTDLAALLATRPAPTPTLIPTFTPLPTIPAATVVAETAVATPTATSSPAPTAAPTIPVTPPAGQVTLAGFTHDWQTWNNCGPTTISMQLSYFGLDADQAEAAQFLKPNADDKNVGPEELAGYARQQGFAVIVGVGGNLELLQHLLSNGFPVIVETWLDPVDRGGLGHYRLFSGYDAEGGYFLAQDSLRGPDIQVPMAEFDDLWRVFNRTYVLVYRPEQEAQVLAILGPAGEEETMLANALRTAQAEAEARPEDAYAWFNLGSSYVALGEMEQAAVAFDQARRIGLPFRMLWYQFGIFEAYLQAGRYQEVIDLTTATLGGTGGLEELYYYRGQARQATGDAEAAIADFQAALDYNPLFTPAAAALGEEID